MLETDMTSFINNLKFGDKITMPCHEGDTYVAIVQSMDDEYIYYIDEYNEEIQYIEKDSGVIYPYQEPIDEKKTMKCLTVGQLKEVLKDLDEHYIVQLSIGEEYANLTHIFVNTDYGSVELTDYNVDDEK